MGKINKIRVGGSIYDISDFVTQEALTAETDRAYNAEEGIKVEQQRIVALAESSDVRLDILTRESGDGSIQKQIEDTIAAQVNVNPEVLDKLEEITQWIENDETGSADLVASVQRNANDIEELRGKSIYLTEEEYQYLVDNNLVQEDVEYNIYED